MNRLKKRFIGSAPVKEIIEQSKKVYVPGFGHHSVHDIWPPFIQQLRKNNIFERAAAISFNVFMGVPPTLIFIFTLIPYLPISKQFINEMFSLIRDIVPGEKNNSVIINFINDFISQTHNELLSFGLLLALVFSSNAMVGVLRSFDKNYLGFVERSSFIRRKTAMELTLVVFVLAFVCILLLIAQGAVLKWLGVENALVRAIIHNFRWVIIVLLVFYCISIVYRHGPSLAHKWPFITPGSVFATTLLTLATLVVTLWVNNFSAYNNKFYSSIGAVFFIMSLIYAYALVVLIGFELNVTITSLRNKEV